MSVAFTIEEISTNLEFIPILWAAKVTAFKQHDEPLFLRPAWDKFLTLNESVLVSTVDGPGILSSQLFLLLFAAGGAGSSESSLLFS